MDLSKSANSSSWPNFDASSLLSWNSSSSLLDTWPAISLAIYCGDIAYSRSYFLCLFANSGDLKGSGDSSSSNLASSIVGSSGILLEQAVSYTSKTQARSAEAALLLFEACSTVRLQASTWILIFFKVSGCSLIGFKDISACIKVDFPSIFLRLDHSKSFSSRMIATSSTIYFTIAGGLAKDLSSVILLLQRLFIFFLN